MTRIVGLTGGIGSGKSTVSSFLEEMGAVIIDADSLAHEAMHPGTEIFRDVVAAFGKDIVSPGGEINRRALARIVFKSPERLARLNGIVHPRLRETARALIEEHRRQDAPVVVIEAPLLIEVGWDTMVDEVWVVTASEPKILERLGKLRGMEREDILARIRSQLPETERLKHADAVINNDGSLEELRAKVAALWRRLASDVQRG